MPELPGGTLTVLHTDVEESTPLTVHLGDRYPEVLAIHRTLLRAAVAAREGYEVDTQGDSFFVVFARATQAIAAAVAIQRALAAEAWPEGGAVRVRIGVHTGEPIRTAEGYTGLDVIRGARIKEAGHGGQVLLSKSPPSRTHLPTHHPRLAGRLPTPSVAGYPRARTPWPPAGAGADDGALRRHPWRDCPARRARRPPLARDASAVHRARPPGACPSRWGRDKCGC